MSDALTGKILQALDRQMYGKTEDMQQRAGAEESNSGGNGTSEDWYRRVTIRKDGRTRTHKRRVLASLWKKPTKKKEMEQAKRDGARKYYASWLWNY